MNLLMTLTRILRQGTKEEQDIVVAVLRITICGVWNGRLKIWMERSYNMSGTPDGAFKAQETILGKYGLTKDGKSALHVKVGAIGGRVSRGGGICSHGKIQS